MKAKQRNRRLESNGTHRGKVCLAYAELMGRWRREKARRRKAAQASGSRVPQRRDAATAELGLSGLALERLRETVVSVHRDLSGGDAVS